MDLPFGQGFGDDSEVSQPRVRRRSDHDLEDVITGDLTHRSDIARRRRCGDERFELREVDAVGEIVFGALVGFEAGEVIAAVDGFEIVPDGIVGGEDRGGGAELGTHVRNHVTVHGREVLQPVPVVFDDLADSALDPVAAQHFEDDIFGGDPVGQCSREFDAHDLRGADEEGLTSHGHGDLEAADADGEHSQGTGGAGVRVRADESRPGFAEPGLVDGVGDAVAGRGEPQSEACGRRAEELVVLRVLLIGLEQVVVDVLHRQIRADPVEAERFELEHDQGACRILGESLVDPDPEFASGSELPGLQMRSDELLSNVLSHCPPPSAVRDPPKPHGFRWSIHASPRLGGSQGPPSGSKERSVVIGGRSAYLNHAGTA